MNVHRLTNHRSVSIATAVVAVGAVAYAAIVDVQARRLQRHTSDCGADRLSSRRGSSRRLSAKPPACGTTTLATSTTSSRKARSRSRTGADKSTSTPKGEAFETSEGRVHRAYNLGSEDAIEYNMFVGPPNRPIGVNIPDNEHRCGPPSTVEECQNDGWATFNHPAPFANQGACVAYVNHRKRITVLVPEDPIQ